MTEDLPVDQGSPTPTEAQPEATEAVDASAPESEGTEPEPTGTLLSESKAEEGEPKADEAVEAEVADYGELSVPEGATFDEQHVESLKEFAQAEGFTPAQAAKLIERDAKLQADSAAAEKTAWDKNVAQLRKETESDPDFGGEHLKENMQHAQRALAAHDPDGSVSAFLERSGLANDIGALKFLASVGAPLAEPNSLVDGDEAAEPRTASLKGLFPNSYQEMERLKAAAGGV